MPPRRRKGAPILVAADDDWEALGRMVLMLQDCDTIPVSTWPKLKDAVERFQPDLVLLADTIRYPRSSAERIVERLYSEQKASVLLLSEFVTPEATATWRERGAADCMLHPTKHLMRMSRLKERIYELTVLAPARR
jgi:DNA-binding response OmpR family regulator